MTGVPGWSVIRRRLRALFARDTVEHEMDEELQLHLEMQAREHERRGLLPNEARRAAVHSFGGIEAVKESYRDARGVRPLENLMQDVRYAIRSLLRQPIFTATAILTLAIGLGATTAILTLVNTAWFSWSSAYPDGNRLVMLLQEFKGRGTGPTSPFDLRDWQRDAKAFAGIAGYMRTGSRLVADKEPLLVGGAATTANFFTVLGLRPVLGRFYRAEEEQWGRNRVVVLSYNTWRRSFAGDRGVVGRRVMIDDAPSEVIGVAPQGTWFGSTSPSIFVPYGFAPDDPRNTRTSHFVTSIARLAPGVTLDAARADMRAVAARITRENPENEGKSATAELLKDVMLGDVRPTLRLLIAASLLLLAIACANVANLLLVRGAARFREMAVRAALGASTRRISQQLLTEAGILAFAGGALGMLIAFSLLRFLGGSLPLDLPRVSDVGVHIDWRIAIVSFLIVMVTGVICGLLPSLQLARGAASREASSALREGSRSVAGGRRSGMVRRTLVVAQVAVGFVLLVTSGLLVHSLVEIQRRDTGVRADNVMSVGLTLPRSRALDAGATTRFFDEAVRRVGALPSVTAAGVSSNLPLTGGGETKSFHIEGKAPATRAELGSVVGRMESASSLQAVGATLIKGRYFEQTDRAGAPNVAIIGESVARKYFHGEDPIGKRISLHPPEAMSPKNRLPPGGMWPRWTVVGVIKDVNYRDLREVPEDAVFVHYPQGLQVWSWGPRWLVARTSGPSASLAASIRDVLRELDPTLPLGDMLPLASRMDLTLKAPRFTAMLIATFAIVAMLLCAIGLYGVIAYAVSQEARSFGVRIALGATGGEIARQVLSRGARVAVSGIAVGVILAFATQKFLTAHLFGVAALDPATYASATLLLISVTLLASYLPARRAARTDPLTVLRTD